MRKVVTTSYIAFDGKQFDREYDCVAYEKKLYGYIPPSSLCILDKDYNILEVNSSNYVSKSAYMYVGDNNGLEFLKNKIFGAEDNLPEECGVYYWDEIDECWVNIEYKIEELINLKGSIETSVESFSNNTQPDNKL